MHGKTTFILTDKDTGKIVEKREEHNMVTDALKDIMNIPRIGMLYGNFINYFNNFLPFYNIILHGLVLFGENIPEKKDDYIMDGRYDIVGTAGAAYTGTDLKRGCFNSNESGQIENGYRFVWDFSPERALGTIKCASLSSLQTGNMGGTFSAGTTLMNVYDAANTTSSRISAFDSNTTGQYGMNYGKNCHYFYVHTSNSATSITLNKYRQIDVDAIGICSNRTSVLESSKVIPTPFGVRTVFPNVYDGKLYIFNVYYLGSSQKFIKIKVGEIDVETGECRSIVDDDIELNIPGANSNVSSSIPALYNNQLYIAHGSTIYVHNLDGTLVKTISTKMTDPNKFFLKDRKLHLICRHAEYNFPCYMVLDDELRYLPIISSFQNESFFDNENVKKPYVATSSGSYLYLMMRTDYLATINNLSEPLEKTDQHALQVRYEITDE